MNDDPQLMDFAKELHRLIEQKPPVSYERMLKFIQKDPCMLAEGIQDPDFRSRHYPAPLNYAVSCNNLPAAQAMLKILTDKKHAKTIYDYVTRYLNQGDFPPDMSMEKRYHIEYPLDHVVYTDSHVYVKGVARTLPHATVKSAEMLEVLHHGGYDLHIKKHDSATSLLTDLQQRAIMNFMHGDLDIDQIPPSFFRTFVELAVDQNVKTTERTPPGRYKNVNFPNALFTQLVIHPGEGNWAAKSGKILEKWALAGLDFREVLKGEYHYNVMAPGTEEGLEKLSHASVNLFTFCQMQIIEYMAHPNAESVRAACAGDGFQHLLNQCVESDKHRRVSKDVPQLISYLDDFWKGEYSQMIRAAEAISTRVAYTKPEAASLRTYASDADVPVGVPRV